MFNFVEGINKQICGQNSLNFILENHDYLYNFQSGAVVFWDGLVRSFVKYEYERIVSTFVDVSNKCRYLDT